MGPSAKQWKAINDRVERWGAALADSINEHGAENSFGVVELVGLYARLTPREGYYLGHCRLDMLGARLFFAHQLSVVITYSRGRFYTSPSGPPPS